MTGQPEAPELDATVAEYIERRVAAWPDLTPAQLSQLQVLLASPAGDSDD